MPRSPAGCRRQTPPSRHQGICRILQPSAATPGDWTEDSMGDPSPASPAEARKAPHGSRSSMDCTTTSGMLCEPGPSEQPRTGFSAGTGLRIGPTCGKGDGKDYQCGGTSTHLWRSCPAISGDAHMQRKQSRGFRAAKPLAEGYPGFFTGRWNSPRPAYCRPHMTQSLR